MKYKIYKKKFKEHSKEFLKLLKEASPEQAIRAITHKTPLLVFWVSPEGRIIDAKDAHFDNPPPGDRSILSHKTHKGHLRGRSALIGNTIYIVIYADNLNDLSMRQEALLRRSYPKILRIIQEKNPTITQAMIDGAFFIKESGEEITV